MYISDQKINLKIIKTTIVDNPIKIAHENINRIKWNVITVKQLTTFITKDEIVQTKKLIMPIILNSMSTGLKTNLKLGLGCSLSMGAGVSNSGLDFC
jgi:hypothetical protein